MEIRGDLPLAAVGGRRTSTRTDLAKSSDSSRPLCCI
jgi:hypothetical protein